ncbi:unnamed protein product, partial [Dovyalis caffra]
VPRVKQCGISLLPSLYLPPRQVPRVKQCGISLPSSLYLPPSKVFEKLYGPYHLKEVFDARHYCDDPIIDIERGGERVKDPPLVPIDMNSLLDVMAT